MASLTFLGAAGTVTGSKHLLDTGTHRVLFDCGLFQGLKELRQRNWQPLPTSPSAIDAVVLTHAHLDHCGYLPRLVAGGFRGRIFCTPATKDLCGLVLPDAAHIQEEDARAANLARTGLIASSRPLRVRRPSAATAITPPERSTASMLRTPVESRPWRSTGMAPHWRRNQLTIGTLNMDALTTVAVLGKGSITMSAGTSSRLA